MLQNRALQRRSVSAFNERKKSCVPLEQLRTQSPPIMAKEQLVTADQVQQHSEAENCRVVIDGQVWDVAEFAPEAPGRRCRSDRCSNSYFTYPS